MLFVTLGTVVVGPASPAQADPGCQNTGILAVWARGSSQGFNTQNTEFTNFRDYLQAWFPNTPFATVQVGNEDGDTDSGLGATNVDSGEYPAVGGPNWIAYQIHDGTWQFPGYDVSVDIGTDGLVAYLNQRVIRCPNETFVLGGYSQGADVVGWALARTGYGGLSQAARDHIGYAALYGDPKFNAGNPYDRVLGRAPWWAKGNSRGYYEVEGALFPLNGVLGARSSYISSEFKDRFGSWCDDGDTVCTSKKLAWPLAGTHTSAYIGANGWIAKSVIAEIVPALSAKRDYLNPSTPKVLGASTFAPPAPPQTLTLTQSVSMWPSSGARAYQPLRWSFTVKNTSGYAASIARLVVAVRAPDGSPQDVPCSGGYGVSLQPNQTWTCDAPLSQGYGSQGTYTMWADWMGYDGEWHDGELGGNLSFTLGAPYTLSAAQPVSVGPSDNMAKFTPVWFSYRVRNNSGSAASIQRFVVAVRAPDGSAQDVQCQNGTGVTIQPNQEWTCAAPLPQGYGSSGTYTFWADWQGYDGSWHDTQLGWHNTFTEYQGPTLTTVGALSVGPSSSLAMYQPIRWSYRVRNTSGAWASIQKFSVPVRGPGGVPLDVPCANGTGVTLAPNEEWTCDAKLSTGYGSQGTYTFWADWQSYDGAWHQGNLSGNLTFTLGPPNTLSTTQYVAVSPTSPAANSSVTFTYQAKNTSGVPASVERFVVAVRGPLGEALDVPCAGGNGVPLAANATFTCTATVPSGYATGVYTYWADWMAYGGAWHDGQLSDVHAFTVN